MVCSCCSTSSVVLVVTRGPESTTTSPSSSTTCRFTLVSICLVVVISFFFRVSHSSESGNELNIIRYIIFGKKLKISLSLSLFGVRENNRKARKRERKKGGRKGKVDPFTIRFATSNKNKRKFTLKLIRCTVNVCQTSV